MANQQSWEEYMANKQAGRNKPGGFVAPDRYTPDWIGDSSRITEIKTGEEPIQTGAGPTSIEQWAEGSGVQEVREAPPRAPQPVPEWQIESLAPSGSRVINVQAYHPDRDLTVTFGLEAFYDSNVVTSGNVQGAMRALVNVYKGLGVHIANPRRAPKQELMEEMYQLLSIVMEDPVASKYGPQWSTVRTQFEGM